jgi:hypothetical protein
MWLRVDKLREKSQMQPSSNSWPVAVKDRTNAVCAIAGLSQTIPGRGGRLTVITGGGRKKMRQLVGVGSVVLA